MKPLMTFALVLAICCSASATDIYVSKTGNDQANGSQTSPLATLSAARNLARNFAGKETITIHVADGVYYLPETLVFAPEDSGTAEHPITYVAENEGQVVLSGGSLLELTWQSHTDGVMKATTPEGLVIDQLFISGKNQRMARYPNYDADKKTAAYQGFAADAFSKERASGWADPTGGYIHAMHRSRWGGYHYQITGKNKKGEITYEGGWQNNRQMGMHKKFRMVENIFEELDAPGEWFHDSKNNTLYYMPPADMDLKSAKVEVVRLRHLIEFRGSEKAPVKFISLKGFVVRHAARTFMDTKEPMLRSDWAIYRGGAFFLTGTEDVQIRDTEFDQVGGNAVFASNYNRRVLVKGCHIHDTGASGVCFVGDPDAVYNPCFEYKESNDLTKIDLTPGPKTNNYPSHSTVEDCLIHGIGRVERQPAGVQIEMSARISVLDCSIYDCARAGINIGDGAWGGHLIDRCDVFDTVQETHDHGSFNSWGRDRFWHSDRAASQEVIDKNPALPFLDAMETTVIRNSRWRCDHGWDIDLDDGSSNYDLYNNLMLSGGLKLREGFRRRAWNNITVNNGLHPHVWYKNSDDEVWGNIFMAAPRGARMPSKTVKGKKVDENLYFSSNSAMKDKHAKVGWDLNSIVADPLFVDPASGDYRVREGSPAMKIGFENFPMDQFGVKKPALKEIAATPVLPELPPSNLATTTDSGSLPSYWLGARVASLTGEEFSAFGASKEDGGVAVSEIPEDSSAAAAGLQNGDLIQGANEQPVRDVEDLMAILSAAGDKELNLAILRNQQQTKLTVNQGAFWITESANAANRFSTLTVPAASNATITARPQTGSQPLSVLTDGALGANEYGPVFKNYVSLGVYRIDLGESQAVHSIGTWSTNRSNVRGRQHFTVYGSNAENDPGWKPSDRSKFTPLGTIDTHSLETSAFTATALKARDGDSLGTFRWIYWQVTPVTSSGENTAFQEMHVK